MNCNSVIDCHVYNTFEELSSIQKIWDRFVESVEGDVYFTFDWCRVWWQFYGEKRNLKLYVFYHEKEIVGLFPIFYEIIWLGPVWLKLAKFVGSDFTMIMVNPPVKTDYADEVFGIFFDSIIQKEKCDAIWFGPVGGQYNALSDLRSSISRCKYLFPLHDFVMAPYTTFHLPDTFEEYVQSLSKNQKGNLRRDLNLMNKTFQFSQDVIQDEASVNYEFENFVKMHNEQWEAEGKLGHFNDWPFGLEFNTGLVSQQVKNGRVKLLRLIADGKVVSYQLCFVFGKRWYWRLPARLVGPEWDRFALGRIGLIKEIEEALSEGVKEIEAGAGHYDYKVKLGGVENPLHSILVVRDSLFIRLRASLFLQLSKLLHLLYYRIWFNRLSLKMPLKRKSLWTLWIRTRL